MKKFLAIFAAAAVVGTACFAVIKDRTEKPPAEPETTASQSEQSVTGAQGEYSTTEQSSAVSEEPTQQTSAGTTQGSNSQRSFTSQIDSVSGSLMIVVPDKNCAEYGSSDKISFNAAGINVADENGKAVKADDIKNFSSAKVTYTGEIKETYPAQIDAQRVVLSGREYCNVYFSVDGTVVKILRVKTGESLNSSDMPNAGAYCRDGYHFEYWLDGDKGVSSLANIKDSVTLTAKISKD